MEPTLLAGPIEFTPAEIAFILAVLAAAALVVSAPGWAVLGVVMGRRTGPDATPGRRWRARIGGSLLGIALSAGVSALVGALLDDLDHVVVVALLAAWASCWALAAGLHRSAPTPRPTAPSVRDRPEEGWGR